MKLFRSSRFGCLVIFVFFVQLSLLYWVISEYLFNPLGKKLDEEPNGGKNVIVFNEEELISVFARSTIIPTQNEQLNSSTEQQQESIITKPKDEDEITMATPLSIKQRTVYWTGPEQLAENNGRIERKLTDFEAEGNNILITIRTTQKFHQNRLPVLFDTWINKINGSNVFLVTDREDEEYQRKTSEHGIHYEIVACGKSYSRWSLCCKSGEEMSLMHKPENHQYDWFCHIDDDIYIIYQNLVKLLSLFNPKNESVYIGRAGSMWKYPKKLVVKQTLINDQNEDIRFHFAVGGLYCLSRPMINKVKPWLGNGETMGSTCDQLLEPEDVAVAATVELLANERLTRTNLFHPHGLILSKSVNSKTLKQQVGFAYGCGQLCGHKAYKNNAVKVPNALFPFDKDPSRFKSIHCHVYPEETLCIR